MHPKIRQGEIDPERNLGVLFNEFLELYGKNFNYTDVGISILDGGNFFDRRMRGWGTMGRMLTLSVEDPCDPGSFLPSLAISQ